MDSDVQTWLDELASRRRFGHHDRLGTANLIDDAARARAAASVTTGACVSLARPVVPQPSPRHDDLPGFDVEVFYTDGPIGMGSDHVHMDCHGVSNTHLDGINHIAVNRSWYGGWDVDDPNGPDVASLAAHGLFTRGVVADVCAVRGTDWVDPDRPVSGADIDDALAAAGVTFEPGDALLLYMGRDRYEAAGHDYGGLRGGGAVPGAGSDAARWLVEHDASLLCWDFLDSNHTSEPLAAVHLLIWAVGLLLVDNCDLSAAVERARATGVYTGGLMVAPIAIPGGTGCLADPKLLL